MPNTVLETLNELVQEISEKRTHANAKVQDCKDTLATLEIVLQSKQEALNCAVYEEQVKKKKK